MEPWEAQHDFMITNEERAARTKESFAPASSQALSSKDAIILDGVVDQSTAIDAVDKVKAMADKSRVDIWSRLFGTQAVANTMSDADILQIEQKVALPGNKDYCLACKKHGLVYGNHKDSILHQKMIQRHARCDSLMGRTPGHREYGTGFVPSPKHNVIDEPDLKRFWGENVMDMDKMAMMILKQKGIRVKPSKNGKSYIIEPHFIAGVSLAFVEFAPMTGKYEGGKARLRWPHQLPAFVQPSATSINGQLSWWPVVAISFKEEMESQIAMYMERDAVEDIEDTDDIVLWDGTQEDVAPTVDVAPKDVVAKSRPSVLTGCRSIWCCCQEQLQWDEPEAWPFPLRSRL